MLENKAQIARESIKHPIKRALDPGILIVLTRHNIPGGPPKNGTVDTVDFPGLCSNQQLSFFTLLDRASFPHYHYNNTKIIKFG